MHGVESNFIDILTKAKELGCTESVVKAHVLNGNIDAFVHFRGHTEGAQGDTLPLWDARQFEDVEWQDLGCPFDAEGTYHHGTRSIVPRRESQKASNPQYFVMGWVQLSLDFVAEVLARKAPTSLTGWQVGLRRADGEVFGTWVKERSSLVDSVQGLSHFKVEPSDLVFRREDSHQVCGPTEDPRRIRSLLRVIRALEVMANLPSRGAAPAVELQIQKLGFKGPNDETIRKILEEARSLTADKS